MKFLRDDKFIILGIFLLSLAPLLWFRTGYIITGTDLDYPIFPSERLYERSFAWYEKILTGTDRSNNFASLPYFIPIYILSQLGLDIYNIQKVTYVFWFFLSGLGIYFLTRVIWDKNEKWQKVACFFAAVIFMFNLYQVFVWTRLQLNLSALFLFPVFLGLLIGTIEKNFNIYKSLLVLTIVSIISGTIGIQPPIIYAMFMAIFLYFIYVALPYVIALNFKKVSWIIRVFATFTLVFLLSSSFWVFALLSFIFQSGYADAAHGTEVYSVLPLLSWVSSNTSLLNVIRLFGDAPWFDSWGKQYYFPEFQYYLNNPLLIIASFVLPALVIYGFIAGSKKNKIISFFSLLMLAGIWFSKGTHNPLGKVFLWMVENVPMFWIHRAPWQKFTLITTTGIAILGGTALGIIYERLKKGATVFVITSTLFFLLYNYVFTFGLMFPSQEGDDGFHKFYNLGFHHRFPDYLFETRNFINKQKDIFNIFMLPEDRTNVYNWGYAGAVDISNLLLNKTTLASQYGEGFSPPLSIENIYKSLVNALYNQTELPIEKVLGLYNIKYLLLRNDFVFNFFGDTDAPEFIAHVLNERIDLNHEYTFGEWVLYKINENYIYPLIYSPEKTFFYEGDTEYFPQVLSAKNEFESVQGYHNYNELGDESVYVYELTKSANYSSDLEWNTLWTWPEANINPNSYLYYLVVLKEYITESNIQNELNKVDILIWFSSKRAEEISKYDDIKKQKKMKLVKSYEKDFYTIINIIKTVPLQKRDGAYWDLVKKTILYLNRSLYIIYEVDSDLNNFDRLLEEYKNLINWFDQEQKSICDKNCFIVEIDSEGFYNFQLIKGNFENPEKYYPTEVTIAKQGTPEQKLLLTKAEANNFSLNLTPGTYVLKLNQQASVTELMGNDFTTISWDDSQNLLKELEGIETLLGPDSVGSITSYDLESFPISERIELSFDYLLRDGKLGIAVIEQGYSNRVRASLIRTIEGETPDIKDLTTRQEETLCALTEAGNCYLRFEEKINIKPNTKKLYVYLFTINNLLNDTQYKTTNITLTNNNSSFVLITTKVADQENRKIPKLSFYKINPIKNKVKVENAQDPYLLYFNQSFHNGWRIFKGDGFNNDEYIKSYLNNKVDEYEPKNMLFYDSMFETIGQNQIAAKKHFIGNGFANAWYIEPQDVDNQKDYTLIIEFWPQRLFYFGSLVSLLTLIGLGVSYGVKKNKK